MGKQLHFLKLGHLADVLDEYLHHPPVDTSGHATLHAFTINGHKAPTAPSPAGCRGDVLYYCSPDDDEALTIRQAFSQTFCDQGA